MPRPCRENPLPSAVVVMVVIAAVLSLPQSIMRPSGSGSMPGYTAKRLCPELVFFDSHFDACTEASKAVFETFENVTPLVEGISIDEAFVDVGGLLQMSGTSTQIAARLCVDVACEPALPITLRFRFDDFSRATRSQPVPSPTAATATVQDIALNLLDAAWPMIEERGLTLIGASVENLENEVAEQRALPFSRGDLAVLDSTIDVIRDKFGGTSLTGADRIGSNGGLGVLLLPTDQPELGRWGGGGVRCEFAMRTDLVLNVNSPMVW